MPEISPFRLIIFCLLFFRCSGYAQFPASVDSVYTFIKSNSIHRNTVDWPLADSTFRSELSRSQTLNDTMACFVHVLKQLHDVHSQIYLNNKLYGNFPEFDDSTLTWLRPLNDRAVSTVNRITAARMPGGYAYLRVPSFQVYEPGQVNLYAQALYDSVMHLAAGNPIAFLIDLRLNGGGNLYPMLSGLSALLGDGTVAFETDLDDSIVRTWEIREGNFVIGGHTTTRIQTRPGPGLDSIPVVILTGPVTRSSGSMTAIAFKHRPNTIFIGEPTADGYTTSNGYFQFTPNLSLNFAISFVADRAMQIYKTTVNPDFMVYRGDDFEDWTKDKKLGFALTLPDRGSIK